MTDVGGSSELAERLAPFLDRVLAPEEGAKLLPIFQASMRPCRFHATGIVQSRGGSDGSMSVYHIEVDLLQRAWYERSQNHLGEVLGETWHEDGVTMTPDFRGECPVDRFTSLPLRMVFMWRLPIWGGRFGDYAPLVVQANEEGNYLITLRRLGERHVHGGVVLDAEHLVLLDYALRDQHVMLLDIRPGRPITRGADAEPFDLEGFLRARQDRGRGAKEAEW